MISNCLSTIDNCDLTVTNQSLIDTSKSCSKYLLVILIWHYCYWCCCGCCYCYCSCYCCCHCCSFGLRRVCVWIVYSDGPDYQHVGFVGVSCECTKLRIIQNCHSWGVKWNICWLAFVMQFQIIKISWWWRIWWHVVDVVVVILVVWWFSKVLWVP